MFFIHHERTFIESAAATIEPIATVLVGFYGLVGWILGLGVWRWIGHCDGPG
jgi:hypothetical protein